MIGKNLPEHGLDLSRSIHLTAIEANDVAVLGEEVGHLARIFIVPCLQQLLVNRPNLSYIAAFGFVHISLGRIHKYLHFSSARYSQCLKISCSTKTQCELALAMLRSE